MALSNWEVLCWNNEGKSCLAKLISDDKIVYVEKTDIVVSKYEDDRVYENNNLLFRVNSFDLKIGEEVEVNYDNLGFLVLQPETNLLFAVIKESGEEKLFFIAKYYKIKENDIEYFKKWLIKLCEEGIIKKVPDFKDYFVYNQGDLFLIERFGLKEEVFRKVGEERLLVLKKILDFK